MDAPTVNNSSPDAGASFTLSATVRNQGDGGSSSTTLRYYRSTDGTITRSDTSVGTDSVFRIDASGTSDESISLTAPDSADAYYYGACGGRGVRRVGCDQQLLHWSGGERNRSNIILSA